MNVRLAAAVLLTSAPALEAQSLGDGTRLLGFVETAISSTRGTGVAFGVVTGDMTLQWRPETLDGYGLDLGFDGAKSEDFDALGLYASLVRHVRDIGRIC